MSAQQPDDLAVHSDAPAARIASGREPSAPRSPDPRAGSTKPPTAPATDLTNGRAQARTDDADVLLDVPQLVVEELSLELQGIGVEHLKLETKGLQAGLFLKADFDNAAALTGNPRGKRTPPVEGTARENVVRARLGRHGGGADRGGSEEAAGPDGSRSSGRLETVGRRALDVAAHGGRTVSVAAVGAAGGALLESRLGASSGRRAPLSLRRGKKLAAKLPGSLHLPGGNPGRTVLEKVRETPGLPLARNRGAGNAIEKLRRRLPG